MVFGSIEHKNGNNQALLFIKHMCMPRYQNKNLLRETVFYNHSRSSSISTCTRLSPSNRTGSTATTAFHAGSYARVRNATARPS